MILAGLVLAGCTVGPNYTEPSPSLGTAYGEVRQAPSSPGGKMADGRIVPVADAPERWWALFEDPELNALVDRALKDNRDLKQAVLRIRQARAERAMIGATLLPEVDTTAGYQRGRGSQNVILPLGGSGSGGSGATSGTGTPSSAKSAAPLGHSQAVSEAGGSAPALPSSSSAAPPGGPASPLGEGGLPGATTNLFQAGFDATWELDFFGVTRRAVEAANAEVDAATEAGRSIAVTLLAEVATTYMEVRADQTRMALARRNLSSQRETWEVLKDRARTGFATDLDVAQQAALVATTEAILPSLEMADREAVHALAFMMGADPNALDAELGRPAALPPLPPAVPVGVPSDLLRRRPDVRQAERQLAAATAEVAIARGQLFPQFSLTGAVGLDSSTPKTLLDWSSRYYSISPGVRWPILDWGRVRAGIRVQNELQEQAFVAYQTAVAQALRDVEDSLVRYQGEQTRMEALTRAVSESREARDSAHAELLEGLVDERLTLEADRAVLQNEDALAQSQAMIRTDLISLYKALGGGWER